MANTNETVSYGPYGGPGGGKWNDGVYSSIRELTIYSGDDIYSIQVVYDDQGNEVLGKKHGGDGGTPTTVYLNYPTEYLVSISGYRGGSYGEGYLGVKSLTLESNLKQYGPFGKEEGTRFIVPLPAATGGKIVGLFGREGTHIDSIGAHIKPFSTIIPSVGPFGAKLNRGQQWDDEIYTTIREITIYSGWVIDSIQVVYDLEGRPVSGQKHGGDKGYINPVVKLDFPDEYLVSFSGHCGQVDNMVVIRSLTFQTNKRSFGPFGMEEGEKFEFAPTDGKIIGFHGSSHDYLTSIGAYLDK